MSYRPVESEKTKADGSYMGFTVTVIISVWLPLCSHPPLDSFFTFLSYSLSMAPGPLPPPARGNQWEPVTVCEQRHYSGDSVCPIKHKKTWRLLR